MTGVYLENPNWRPPAHVYLEASISRRLSRGVYLEASISRRLSRGVYLEASISRRLSREPERDLSYVSVYLAAVHPTSVRSK